MSFNFSTDIKDKKLLELALTHSSYTKDFPEIENNERLEFYGDAVLKLVISKYLYNRFPMEKEGKLTKYRARLISDDLLADLADKLDLENRIIAGSSMQTRRLPRSVKGDALEALIGAVYIDSGYEAAEKLILDLWQDSIEKALVEALETDYKSLLQEKTQKSCKSHPTYEILRSIGPDHAKDFEVGVYLGEELLAKAVGKSKKIAGQEAAKLALEFLGKAKND